MATPRIIGRAAPACLSCLRRVTLQTTSTTTGTAIGAMQARGKATKAELEDLQGIPVRLLEDIVGFGRKDTIMRVKPGRMRNYWFPRGRAEYMTKQRFREMGLTEAAIGVRDRTFGAPRSVLDAMETRDVEAAFIEGEAAAARKRKEALTLPPEQVHELLANLLPPVLTFERKPIAVPTPTATETAAPADEVMRRSPLIASNAVVSGEEGDEVSSATPTVTVPKPPSGPIAIFGSVSTVDILGRIAEILAADTANGGRAALDQGAVTIVGLEEGEDRIKRIGVFEVEIVAGKGLEPIIRRVEVVPEALPEI
ncbi:hypothetical protein Micbo1qcDRAFT_161867 [Microdochium bolleyi]|uniref:Ribosomal protein L9 domain-containing protein n=1 Tax=Microdochium bolleyi TaxID=196109 RepID=A0A136J3M5_9PEZI|nr:hypothetical protein Micbo1qcDRAFT_161867 [Microdochium bolleyi]